MSTVPPPPPGRPRVIVDTLDGVTTITAVGAPVGPPDALRYTSTARSFTRPEVEHLHAAAHTVEACAAVLCAAVGIEPGRVDLPAVAAAVIAGESRSFGASVAPKPTDAGIATLARAANVLLTRPGEEPAILCAARHGEAEPGASVSYNVVARDKHVAWAVAEVVRQMLRARGWPDAPVTVQSPGRGLLPDYAVIYAAE